MIDKSTLAQLTAEVVSSYVGNNSSLTEAELDRAVAKLPLLIDSVHAALLKIIEGGDLAEAEAPASEKSDQPAVQAATAPQAVLSAPAQRVSQDVVRNSIHHDYLICLEDGRRFKTLKRHLASKYGLSPEAYRAKWGLPPDYPMACKAYTDSRSNVAKRIGLGVGGRGSKPAFVAPKRKLRAAR